MSEKGPFGWKRDHFFGFPVKKSLKGTFCRLRDLVSTTACDPIFWKMRHTHRHTQTKLKSTQCKKIEELIARGGGGGRFIPDSRVVLQDLFKIRYFRDF